MNVIHELDILIEQKYTVRLEKDDDDGGYVVTIPTIPGAISDGDTGEEALNSHERNCFLVYSCICVVRDGICLWQNR